MKSLNFSWVKYAHMITALSIAALFSLTSCETGNDVIDNVVDELTSEDEALVVNESAVEAAYEDIDLLAMDAMEITDETAEKRDISDLDLSLHKSGSCPTVTHDSVAKTILLDFGTGCVGPDGKTRSGQVLVAYTTRLYKPGASLTAKLINYMVDSLSIEGTRRIENISPNLQAPISLKTTLRGGKVTWPDGTFATREATFTRTWYRAANPILDEFHVDGGYTGMTRAGEGYTMRIVSTLIFKRKCKRAHINIPVKGLKLFTYTNKPTVLVDFGDGICDKLITVTKNGNSKVIQL